MTAKEILFQQEARGQLLAGAHAITRAVRISLGPRGRHVLIDKNRGAPTVTKDGVTIARAIELEHRIQNAGAQLVQEAASKTSAMAGDGTTTATVLADAILQAGHRLVVAGHCPMDLRRGIERAVAVVVEDLAKRSKPARETDAIIQVGTLAANGDASIGQLLGEAMQKVGRDGVITVEEAHSIDSTLEVVEGMQLDRGYISPYFVTDPATLEVVLEDALILLHEKPLHTLPDLLPLLRAVAAQERPLLIVAEDVSGEALTTLIVNHVRGTLICAAIKAPGFGERRRERLADLAILTGGQVFSAELGLKLENIQLTQLGGAKKIVIDPHHTTLIGSRGDKAQVEARCRQIRQQLENAPGDYDREQLQERLGKLSGGVAIIRVGAATESALKEKKARVEDALHATRAAVEEGIVPGGGVALLRAQEALVALEASLASAERPGVAIVWRALEEPLRQIAENAGIEGSVAVQKVKQLAGAVGLNARSGKYEDLLLCGVVDPTKVVRSALQNAASVAALLLTADAAIADKL